MGTLTKEGLRSVLAGFGVEEPLTDHSGLDVLNDLLDVYRAYLADFIVRETQCHHETALRCLQWPSELGDLVAVIPRLRLQSVDAAELAAELAAKFPVSELFAQPFEDGINLRFMFAEQNLWRMLVPFILDRGSAYGTKTISSEAAAVPNRKQRLLIEYSSPNIGKAFDGNHLRSTIVGNFIASTYSSSGWDVTRMTFFGDWGKHIGMLAAGWRRFGSAEELDRRPLQHLIDIGAQVEKLKQSPRSPGEDASSSNWSTTAEELDAEKDTFFKELEEGTLESLELWKKLRDAAVVAYKRLYDHMEVPFDVYSAESEVSIDSIRDTEKLLTDAGVYELSEGAWVIDYKKHGYPGLGTGIARYKNGTTSYLLRDIAAVLYRNEAHQFDKLLYVVAAKQDSHFRQILACLQMMGLKDLAGKIEHISFNSVKSPSSIKSSSHGVVEESGGKDATRVERQDFGNISTVQDSDPVAEIQGSSESSQNRPKSLAMQILACRRGGSVALHPATSFDDRSSWANLQTCLMQLSMGVGESTACANSPVESPEDSCLLETEDYTEISRHLIHFPAIVQLSFNSLEPNGLMAYLIKLADLVLPILHRTGPAGQIDPKPDQAEFWNAVKQVMRNGMTFLGLGVSERLH